MKSEQNANGDSVASNGLLCTIFLLVQVDFGGLGLCDAYSSKREALKAMLKMKKADVIDRLEAQREFGRQLGDRDFYCGTNPDGEYRVISMQVQSAA